MACFTINQRMNQLWIVMGFRSILNRTPCKLCRKYWLMWISILLRSSPCNYIFLVKICRHKYLVNLKKYVLRYINFLRKPRPCPAQNRNLSNFQTLVRGPTKKNWRLIYHHSCSVKCRGKFSKKGLKCPHFLKKELKVTFVSNKDMKCHLYFK